MKNTNVVVEFNDINFSYNKHKQILKDINFKIYENEYVCVIGHNGSGKSTISRLLVGLLKQDSGKIIINPNFKNIGIVFQNPDNQFIKQTVRDDIAFSLENQQILASNMDKIIDLVANMLNITQYLDNSPVELSGGIKQRVAIASVLALNSDIIIFDESTSLLDSSSKEEIKKLFLLLKNKYNKTIISITHDMESVMHADRVIVLKDGEIIKDSDPTNIFTDIQFLNSTALALPNIIQLSTIIKNNNSNFSIAKTNDEFVKNLCLIKK